MSPPGYFGELGSATAEPLWRAKYTVKYKGNESARLSKRISATYCRGEKVCRKTRKQFWGLRADKQTSNINTNKTTKANKRRADKPNTPPNHPHPVGFQGLKGLACWVDLPSPMGNSTTGQTTNKQTNKPQHEQTRKRTNKSQTHKTGHTNKQHSLIHILPRPQKNK